MSATAQPADSPAPRAAEATAYGILLAISLSHGLNDVLQSLIPAMYPILKDGFRLDFGQIGLIQLTFQLTASVLQPVVGIVTDKRPQPFSLAVGMGATLCGLLLLASATTYAMLLVSVALVGVGSSIFHPESSRVARMASGGRYGLAQSLFQVGGNVGSAAGPLLAAFVVLPHGQSSIAWFSGIALLGILILTRVGFWYRDRRRAQVSTAGSARRSVVAPPPRGVVIGSVAVLIALMFSKFFYMAALGNYLTFYVIETFGVSVQNAQLLLFLYLGAVALGTFAGGPIGDRFGRRFVMWFSILGALPFSLALPHVGLPATIVLAMIAGFIMSSAFSAIVVYAQDLMPGKVGMVSGLFFGLAFGLGGLGAAALGELADLTSIGFVYKVCAWLPAIGLLTWFLPRLDRKPG